MSLNGSGEGEGKEDVAEVSTALQIVFKIEGFKNPTADALGRAKILLFLYFLS